MYPASMWRIALDDDARYENFRWFAASQSGRVGLSMTPASYFVQCTNVLLARSSLFNGQHRGKVNPAARVRMLRQHKLGRRPKLSAGTYITTLSSCSTKLRTLTTASQAL
jgi:hypothetical protein